MPTAKQRRDAELRRLRRKQQRLAQKEARRRRFALIASIVGTLVIVAVVVTVVVATGNDKSSKSGAKGFSCTWTRSGTPAKPATVPPTTKPPRSGSVDLVVTTTQGKMRFALNRAAAPCAVESFVSLAEQHYFDSTPCHRLTSGTLSVLQCGDPTGTGSGGPGYSFADELTGRETYTRGVLAMANSGPNTNGSQFFIVYKNSQLSPNYTVFGKVTSGLGVVDSVAAKGATPAGDGKPNLPIQLTSVSVVQ